MIPQTLQTLPTAFGTKAKPLTKAPCIGFPCFGNTDLLCGFPLHQCFIFSCLCPNLTWNVRFHNLHAHSLPFLHYF